MSEKEKIFGLISKENLAKWGKGAALIGVGLLGLAWLL